MVEFLIGLALVVVCIMGGITTYSENQWDKKCLAHGYPKSEWQMTGPNYCVKRVDQTDIVVPESEIN